MDREQLEEIWETVYYTEDMQSKIRDLAPGLIQFLIVSLLEDGDIEIGLFESRDYKGSVVAYDIYNTDKMLHLRYKQDTSFELYLSLENDDCEMEDFYHTLTDAEIKIIPEGLQNLMKQAWDKGETRTYRKGTIE